MVKIVPSGRYLGVMFLRWADQINIVGHGNHRCIQLEKVGEYIFAFLSGSSFILFMTWICLQSIRCDNGPLAGFRVKDKGRGRAHGSVMVVNGCPSTPNSLWPGMCSYFKIWPCYLSCIICRLPPGLPHLSPKLCHNVCGTVVHWRSFSFSANIFFFHLSSPPRLYNHASSFDLSI